MSDDLRIVEFEMGHYGAARALWETSPGVVLDEDVDSPEAIGRYLERNPGLSFVALAGDRLVGVCMSGWDGRRAYLQHLAVDGGARRQGIGRRLVAACIDAQRAAGISRCHLFVAADNAAGRAFWERLGWSDRAQYAFMTRRTDALDS